MIGRVLGQRYKLEEFIGKGGMALVFRATDLRTGHNVAVKILRPEFNNDKEFLERFQREALAASKVSHHNIVNLLDVGEEEGCRYLVMEYMRGRTLKEIIAEKGRLPESVAAQIAIRILSALQHAHNNGIIHRDIKPQNILVNSEGHIKVADFGIARVAGSKTLSKGDSVMGSVHYFSPEQARGDNVTYASDIYSVGVVMYEMLTGRVPFDGDTAVNIAMQHISAQPKPPSLVADGISPAMEQVVLIAMSKEPRNRYSDAADMARAIRAALQNPKASTASVTQEATSSGRVRVNTGRMQEIKWQRRIRRIRETVLLVALTAVVLAALAYGSVQIVQGVVNRTEAPYLIGETEKEALRLGQEKGLVVEVVRQSDSKTPAGIVMTQSREYQYVMKRGDVIVITVSTGPEKQGVPQLTGMELEAANTEAAKYGFTVLVTERRESDEKLNTVLEQTPAAGETLAYGEIIQVVVSGSVTMPRVTDQTLQQAVSALQVAGFVGTVQVIEHETTDAQRVDRVADQLPKAGERVLNDSAVTLVIYVQTGDKQENP